jgi:hypothetical protein
MNPGLPVFNKTHLFLSKFIHENLNGQLQAVFFHTIKNKPAVK